MAGQRMPGKLQHADPATPASHTVNRKSLHRRVQAGKHGTRRALRPAARESGMYFREMRVNWSTLIGAGVGMALGSALNHYMMNLFGPEMIEDLGWTRAEFALLGSLPLLLMLFVPFAGRFVDRFGSRVAATVGFTVVPLGYLGMSLIEGPIWQFFALYVVQHVFGMLTTTMVFGRVVVERFDAMRGIALSIVISAPPLAGAIGAPLMGRFIAAEGWRAGFVAMAVVTVIGGLIAIALIGGKRKPAAAVARQPAVKLSRAELFDLLRHPTLILIMAGMFLVNVPQIFASSQLKLVAMDSGVTDSMATWMISLYAIGVVVGRFLSGIALDSKVPPNIVALAALGLPAIGFVIFASSVTATSLLILAVTIIGLAQGAEADVGAYLISRRFDLKNFSLLLSLTTMMIGFGSAAGSVLLSLTLHEGGGYGPFLIVSAVATLVGAALFGLTGTGWSKRDKTRHDAEEAVIDQAIAGEIA
jgi:MFS family permease